MRDSKAALIDDIQVQLFMGLNWCWPTKCILGKEIRES